MLQQGRGLSALASGLLFLPLTGLIAIGTVCAAPLAQRIGRPRRPGHRPGCPGRHAPRGGVGQHLIRALAPGACPCSRRIQLGTTRAHHDLAVYRRRRIRPDGAASAAFNTSRQVGSAIGIAIFGPLLGATHNLRDGFITCVVVASAATAAALLLTALARSATAPARTDSLKCLRDAQPRPQTHLASCR
jgi:DHA2 family methylenomycin A resistance protein-like MFS transporter